MSISFMRNEADSSRTSGGTFSASSTSGAPCPAPKRSLKREGTEPNGCGGFRYYYHITRHNGGVRVESGGDDDCVAGNGTETRYEKRGGKIIITHKVFAS